MLCNIEPDKLYTINEVVANEFIPGGTSYYILYNLISKKEVGPNGEEAVRTLNSETTPMRLKPSSGKQPWNKISRKIHIQGAEIIKFLQLNNLM